MISVPLTAENKRYASGDNVFFMYEIVKYF